MKPIELWKGDCLELMKNIPDGSVDLVLTDPPYGTMKNAPIDSWLNRGENTEWDTAIEPVKFFEQISRVLRPNGKAVLFSQEPYTSRLITSAIPSLPFAYRAVWYKNVSGNSLMAKSAMVSRYEDVCLFSRIGTDKDHSNPLRKTMKKYVEKYGKEKIIELFEKEGRYTSSLSARVHASYKFGFNGGERMDLLDKNLYVFLRKNGIDFVEEWEELENLYKTHETKRSSVFNLWQGGKSKSNVLEYKKDNDGYHPTQKPVALLEDLIQTYSNDGNTVLDFTMGSGSTGVACVNTGRKFIGIELDEGYFNIAKKRVVEAYAD